MIQLRLSRLRGACYFTIFFALGLFLTPSVIKAQCSITTTVNVSDCFDSNGNTAGGTNQTSVQVIVDWQNRPGTENILLKLQGQANVTIDPDLVSKPYFYTYTLTADGTSKTVDANFSTTTTCKSTQRTAVLPAGSCLLTPCATGNTGGIVWRDFDNDGSKDATETQGIGEITVTAYDCNGNLAGTTTTDYLGQYTFGTLSPTPSATNKYRIEFSNIPPQYEPTFNGTNGRTDVQFISAASCVVNLGVNNPGDYCQTNPLAATPCYINGNNLGPQDVFVAIKYDETLPVEHIGLASQIGSTWGVAYRGVSKTLFASAVLKRHAGFGKGKDNIYGTADDISTIYVFNNYSGTGAGTVSATINMNSFAGVNVGANPRVGASPANDLIANVASPNHDFGVFGNEAKRGIGDIDISEDGNTLYVLNLNQKQLVALNVSNPTTPTLIGTYAIPNPSDMPTGDQFRPWAIGVHNGVVYIGGVTDASSTKLAANLRAYVMKFDGSSFTTVDIDAASPNMYLSLNYDRLKAYFNNTFTTIAPGEWRPWTDTESDIFNLAAYTVLKSQPILSAIEFTDNGSMVLGFIDRASFQIGAQNYAPTSSNTTLYAHTSAGEILQLCNTGSLSSPTYMPEGKGGCTQTIAAPIDKSDRTAADDVPYASTLPSSYYNNVSLAFTTASEGHAEICFGGVAVKPGTNSLVMTAMNPADALDVLGPRHLYYAGGFRWLNTTTGATQYSFSFYAGQNNGTGTFGKSTGLGDVELLCNPAPIQVGNYVWYDQNKNGVQDPCEKALNGIAVSLWKGGTQIASTTTNGTGEYYFSSKFALGAGWTSTVDTVLLPLTAYEIRIDTVNQPLLDTIKLTTAHSTLNNGNDLNDSDASVVGNYAVIAFTTGTTGSTNHTLDFGFFPCPYIITPSTTQSLCANVAGTNITVRTNINTTNSIKFVKFTSDQRAGTNATAAEAALIYAGTAISTVTPTGASIPYTATYTWNSTDFPNATTSPITYYVYAILATDLGASCRPLQEIAITIKPTPSVNDPADQMVCRSVLTTAVTFAGAISGTTYAWTNNTTSIGLAASGSGDITAFTAVNATASPVVATVTVTPTLNLCVGTVQTFTITVNPKPTLSLGSSACQGGLSKYDVPFTATGGTATTNQGTISGGSVIDVPIASSVTITITNATTGCNISQTVNPPNCTCPTVNAPTTAVDADKTICQGATIPTLTASVGAGETIDWYATSSGGVALVTASTTYTPTAAGTYYAQARNILSGCISAGRSDVSLTINPSPSVSAVGNQSICNGLSTTAVMFGGSAVSGTNYGWTNSDASIGLDANGTGDIGTFDGINTGATAVTATIMVTPTANGCTGTAQTFTITVKPTPSVSTIADQVKCNNTATTLISPIGSTVASTAYNWINNAPSIGLLGTGSGNIAPFTATNSGSSPIIATITVTPVANMCSGLPENFTITVNPTPSVSAVGNQLKCAGAGSDALTFTGSAVTGTDYNWTNSNATIGLGAIGSGNIGTFTTLNTGSTPVIATIVVTPTANNCAGATQTFTITVNPATTSGIGTDPTTATCQAGSGLSNINLAGQITGATVGGTWAQTSGTAVGTALNTTTGVFNPNGITIGTYTFSYTVIGTSPCPDTTTDITITIENCCPPSICIPVTVTRN